MMRMKEVLDRKFGKKLRQVVDLEGKLCRLGELSGRTLKNDKKRYLLPKVRVKESLTLNQSEFENESDTTGEGK